MATQKKKTTPRTNTTRKRRRASAASEAAKKPVRREVGAVICLFLAVFTTLHLFSVSAIFIDFFCGLADALIGRGFIALPFALLGASFILFFHRGRPVALRVWSAMLVPVILGATLHLFTSDKVYALSWGIFSQLAVDAQTGSGGGILGGLLSIGFKAAFSSIGAGIVFIVSLIVLILLSLNLTVAKIFDYFRSWQRPEYEPEPLPERPAKAENTAFRTPLKASQIDIPLDDDPLAGKNKRPGLFSSKPSVPTPADALLNVSAAQASPSSAGAVPGVPAKAADKAKSKPDEDVAELDSVINKALAEEQGYRFPPITLLAEGGPVSSTDGSEELRTNAHRLIETIRSFNIEARILDVTRGPTVTRYELEMDKGVKLSRLTGLSDDIALSLGASGVRISPIPNKVAVIGIEVPNHNVSIVYLRDIIASREFRRASSKVSFAVGKDISGKAIVGDIARLPHLLIAGTTGSGKSVCMNSLIVSLLYKSSPEDVRLIMIDPKMIELGVYNGIPHLLIPVVTDPKKAAGALQWAVTEMMKRYKLFSQLNVRDIYSYNAYLAKNPVEGQQKLPQIVIVIDELADLMLVAAKEVEETVCRIAQMARAAGMHLVIATQRPSADVITGIMKANIPSRIAFAVASQLESRIILDTMGAEKLVGRGDMLFHPLGTTKPTRIQGTLISGSEVEAVVSYIKEIRSAQYDESITAEINRNAEGKTSPSASPGSDDGDEADDLLPAAVDVIMETGQASVSMLQRKLKLGYSRAARLVDQMEERGIVGPFEGSKPRKLLITRQQWQERQMRSTDMYSRGENIDGEE